MKDNKETTTKEVEVKKTSDGLIFTCEEDNRPFPLQECQDPELNRKFREFHQKIVDEIIAFLKENKISVYEVYLHADGLENSIKAGKWLPETDSQFSLSVLPEDIWNEDKKTFIFSM